MNKASGDISRSGVCVDVNFHFSGNAVAGSCGKCMFSFFFFF